VKHRVGRDETVRRLDDLKRGGLEERAALFVEEGGPRGVLAGDLARRLGVDDASLSPVVRALVAGGRSFAVSERPLLLVSSGAVDELFRQMVEELRRYQKANPLRDGMSRGELRERLGAGEVFEWALSRAVEKGLARAARDLVATADHRIALSSEESAARVLLVDAYRRAGYQPPSLSGLLSGLLSDLASGQKRDPRLLERIQRLLIQEGELVRVAEGLIFHRDVLQGLKAAIRERKAVASRIDVQFFKDLAGVSRKFAIPLLEWLDREHVTRRVGNERVIL